MLQRILSTVFGCFSDFEGGTSSIEGGTVKGGWPAVLEIEASKVRILESIGRLSKTFLLQGKERSLIGRWSYSTSSPQSSWNKFDIINFLHVHSPDRRLMPSGVSSCNTKSTAPSTDRFRAGSLRYKQSCRSPRSRPGKDQDRNTSNGTNDG